MNFCDFPEANRHMGAPKDWDPATQGACGVLPVQVTEDGRCISIWAPDVTDRSKIAQGHPIVLDIHGGQPVVAVYVDERHVIPEIDDELAVYNQGYAKATAACRKVLLAILDQGYSITREDIEALPAASPSSPAAAVEAPDPDVPN